MRLSWTTLSSISSPENAIVVSIRTRVMPSICAETLMVKRKKRKEKIYFILVLVLLRTDMVFTFRRLTNFEQSISNTYLTNESNFATCKNKKNIQLDGVWNFEFRLLFGIRSILLKFYPEYSFSFKRKDYLCFG